MAALSDWFHQPHEYEWLIEHRSVRHLQTVVRGAFGMSTLVYAMASVVMLFSPRGPDSDNARMWVLAVLTSQLCVAAGWFFGPLPGSRGLIAFGIFGDVGLSSVLVTYDATAALIGCVFFVVTGAYCTFFLSPRWLTAHMVWCCAFVALTGVRGWSSSAEDPATMIAAATVVFAAVGWIPVFAHVAWTAIAGDARTSARDPLTGLLNRRGLDNAIGELWDGMQNTRSSLAVAMIDIDKFKRVNDIHGHGAGDRVLVDIAHRLDVILGDRGAVARTGGEEFVAIVFGDRREIEDRVAYLTTAVFDGNDPVPVTVSLGAAFLDAESTLQSAGRAVVARMMQEADELMYRSKSSGGNRSSMVVL